MKYGPSKNKFAISALIGTAGGGQPTLIHYTCTVTPSQIFRARKDLWHMQPCRSRVKSGMMEIWKMCWWRLKFHQHQLLPDLYGGLAARAQSEADEWSQLGWVTLGNKKISSWAACFFFGFSNSIFLKGYVLRFFALHVLCHNMSFFFTLSVFLFYFIFKCIFIYIHYIHTYTYKYIYMCRYIFFTSFIFKYMNSSHLAPTNRVDTEINIKIYIYIH